MRNKWFRKILGGLSLTSVLFVFQACYGTPQDFEFDLLLEGQVISEVSGLPITGIRVSVDDTIQYDFTNAEGRFTFFTEKRDSLNIRFDDVDAVENGHYETKDTAIINPGEQVYLDIKMKEK